MRELKIEEYEQVSGGILPLLGYAALVGGSYMAGKKLGKEAVQLMDAAGWLD